MKDSVLYPLDWVEEDLAREPSASFAAGLFASLVNSHVGVIATMQRDNAAPPGEPSSAAVRANLAPTRALSDCGYANKPAVGGRSMALQEAEAAALFEAVERYALSLYFRRDLRLATFEQLIAAGERAVDPYAVACDRTRRELGPSVRDEVLCWSIGHSMRTAEAMCVPAQLVYVPYDFADEPVLRDPLTTGCAAGLAFGSALYRAVLECVERHAVMTSHYRGVGYAAVAREDLGEDALALVSRIEHAGLEVRLLLSDASTDIACVAALVLDDSPSGPRLTTGSKAAADVDAAVTGAVLEAYCFRHALLPRMSLASTVAGELFEPRRTITTAEERAYWWATQEPRDLWYATAALAPRRQPTRTPADVMSAALTLSDAVVIDLTPPELFLSGVHVVRVLMPDLQPLHIDEALVCTGGDSGAVSVLPHPFL